MERTDYPEPVVTRAERTDYPEPVVTRAPPPVEEGPVLRWGAIFAGTVSALGIGAMLYALGLALGLSAIDPQDPSSLRPSGIFGGIWALVVSLVALFIGGFVASRGASAGRRGFGALYGLVVWGLTVVGGVWLLGNLASTMISGAAGIGKTAAQAVAGAVPQGADVAEQLGITSDDVIEPVNRRLRAEGKPEVTADQVQEATRDAVQQGIRSGRLDQQVLTDALAANTALSRTDAADVARRMEARFQSARSRMERGLKDAGTTALAAAEQTGKAFWGLFGALFLGMIAAIGGAILGAHRRGKPKARRVVEYREREAPRAPPREAYP